MALQDENCPQQSGLGLPNLLHTLPRYINKPRVEGRMPAGQAKVLVEIFVVDVVRHILISKFQASFRHIIIIIIFSTRKVFSLQ